MGEGTFSRKALTVAETVTLLIALFAFSLNVAIESTSTPYEIPGTLARYETDYYWILNIQVNETVLINIIPDAYGSYTSEVCYPNLTRIQPPYTNSGGHAYNFIAKESGNYILEIWGNEFSYTIKSSHEIPNGEISQTTPYNALGEIQVHETAWHTIYSITKNETIFINISPNMSGSYESAVCYSNLTQIYYKYTSEGHSYKFIAKEDGDYLLKVWSDQYAINYAIKCSNYVTSEPAIPDFRLTPTAETLTVEIGSSNNTAITIHSQMGYTSDITLNTTSLPAGISAIFNPVQIILPPDELVNSTLTINADLTAQQGTTNLFIIGKSGNLTRYCRMHLAIQEIQNRLPSSSSCYLNATQMTYMQNVFISATVEPQLSTGIMTIQATRDNITWNDLILKVPSEGQCNFIWTPDAGTHFVRAKWSGDYMHLPCISTSRKLIVEKKATTVVVTLSTNIADSGQYVTANATIHPTLSTQKIAIQYSIEDESWQSLASGFTDQSGSFAHTWLPGGNRIFWIRSTWNGTDNYTGNLSVPVILIIETGIPTIATYIENKNTTLMAEYGEEAIVAYNVLDKSSNLIQTDTKELNTLSLGKFDLWMIFLGNETYKSCFYKTNYTVTSIDTKIENIKIISEYSPNLAELLLEYISGTSSENKTYSECSAYVTFDVQKAKSGDLVDKYSLKLDTSTLGYNLIDLMFEGNETHSPASSKAFRYKVLERIPIGTAIQMIIGVTIPVVTLLVGWRTGLWRNWWAKIKERQKKGKEKKKKSLKESKEKAETEKPDK